MNNDIEVTEKITIDENNPIENNIYAVEEKENKNKEELIKLAGKEV